MQLAHSKLRFSENKAGKLAVSALVIIILKKPEIRKQKNNKRTKRICVFTNVTNEPPTKALLCG